MKESQGSVPCDQFRSSPSPTPPKSESKTFQSVQERFSSQFSIPSLSKSPASSRRVGSVSLASICPLPFLSSSPSSSKSSSVLLSRGSLAWAGFPYNPLTSTPSSIPSLSVSTSVGSVSRTRASWESFRPSPSVSAINGFVVNTPSTSAVKVVQPPGPIARTGLQGEIVSVRPLFAGPGWK